MTEADHQVWRGNPALWKPFSQADQADARGALHQWGAASGITFIPVKGGHGDIQFSWTPQKNTSGFGYYPSSHVGASDRKLVTDFAETSGKIYLNADEPRLQRDPALKKYVLLHEIGHTLGLKHPFDSLPYNNHVLSPSAGDVSLTVMAYLKTNQPAPAALGQFDIQAIHKLYGLPETDGKQVAKWNWDAKSQALTQVGRNSSDVLWGTSVTDKMRGEGGNDRLHGFAGDDLLNGGAGLDTLIGGPGRDVFCFDIVSPDRIVDFDADDDKIALSRAAFHELGPRGSLASKAFAIGSTAYDDDVRILFDSGSGRVYYDSDGSGAAQKVLIARLTLDKFDPAVIAANDFLIV